jgi:galactonate dehydratase
VRVTDVKTFLVYPANPQVGFIGGKHWLFVKVETDSGISGWGEAYTFLDRDRNIERHITEMARYLVDRDPSHIKHFTSMIYNDFAGRRGSMDLYSALSAIEQALWDITGRSLGVPVHALLGGPCRERIRVYANGWYAGAAGPDEYAEKAREAVRRGFTALKFDPFPGPWRLFISREQEEIAVETVRAVREAVGPDVELLIEVHRRLAPMHAVRVSRRLETLEPYWFEEPVPAENLDALTEVRRRTSIPVVTGETLYTKNGFREVFEKRAADIINPDVCNCGGILELKEIAAMAEPSFVAVAPHNYNSTTIGLAATVQVAACIPNFLITEYFLNFEETGKAIAVGCLEPEDGSIPVPKEPGLAISLQEEELRRRAG